MGGMRMSSPRYEKPIIEKNWYRFRQNNIRGYFQHPAVEVFVEALDSDHADRIAERGIGLSFTEYCECCGHRWRKASEDDAQKEAPSPNGGVNEDNVKKVLIFKMGSKQLTP